MMKHLLILVCLASSLGVSFAQDYRGTVQGLVTDSSQAVIVGAKVTLLNINMGISVAKESNNLGNYRFDFVEPGTYTVVAEVVGFAKSIQQNVMIEAKGDITVNFTLKPGHVNESVTVTATAVALQLNTSTKDLTVTRTQLMNLPFQERNPYMAALLDPAVQNNYPAAPAPYHMWQASEMDFGGQTSRQNDVLIDGSSVMIGPKGSYTPAMDSVQEMVVEQVAVDAEYGHSAGGVINLATREGTNTLHGTAFYYGINPSLNAVTNALTRTPSVSRNNIWGGAAGGPIKKNKVFTFGSYEGRILSSPQSVIMTLPTAAERNGDFSQSMNINGDLRTIYNPFSTTFDPDTGVATRTPFTGNAIPPSMIDPTAAKMMSYIWKPNTPAANVAGADNFRVSVGLGTHYWNVSDRTDWNASDKLRVFGRYSQFHAVNGLPDYTGTRSPAEVDGQGGVMASKNLGGDAVYTINPTTVADVRFSYTSFKDNAGVPQNEIGASGLASLWPNDSWYQSYLDQYGGSIYFPSLKMGANQFGVSSLYYQQPHSYTLTGKIVKSTGRHNLKGGLEARYQSAFISYPGQMGFNFGAATTSSTFINAPVSMSGDPYATFLLGAPDDSSSTGYVAPGHISAHYFGAYVQDDFKLNRRITLNLGLRYEYESAPVDAQNHYTRLLDLNATNPTLQANPPQYTADVSALRSQYLGANAATPAPNGQWLFADSSHRTQFDAPTLNFAPRAGIAFRLNDKTVFIAGYGRFLVLNSQVQNGLLSNPGFVGYNATSSILPSQEGVPTTALSNPFPSDNPLQSVHGSSLGVNTNLGNGYGDDWGDGFRAPNYKDGALDRFNLTVERELPWKLRLDISFVATNGRHLDSYAWWDSFPANESNPNLFYDTLKGQMYQQYPNPFYHYLTPTQFPGGLRNRATVPLYQLLRPYPQYNEIWESHVPVEGDTVRNLEIRVQRAYANGFSLLGSYLYNHEQSTWWPDAWDFTDGPYYYNRTPGWSEGTYPRHRAIVSSIYALPFGRGRKKLSHLNPVVEGLVGGWSLSSIVNITSGQPLNFANGSAYVMAGDPSQNAPSGYAFNPGVFANLPAYTPYNGPKVFPGVDGPVQWNIDAQLSKSFRIREGMNLQFRAEAYNLTNSIVWAPEDANFGDSQFGQKNLAQNNIGRTIQYSLRLSF
jgi:hypothetical protein